MGIISLPAHHASVVIFFHCLPRTAVVGREYTYKGSSILSSLLSPFVCSVTKVISLPFLHSLSLLRSALGFHQRGAKRKRKEKEKKKRAFSTFSLAKKQRFFFLHLLLLLSPSCFSHGGGGRRGRKRRRRRK